VIECTDVAPWEARGAWPLPLAPRQPVRIIRTIRGILFRDQVHDPSGSGRGADGAVLRPFLSQSGTCPQNPRNPRYSDPAAFLSGCWPGPSGLPALLLLCATCPRNPRNPRYSDPEAFSRIFRILRTHLQGYSSTPTTSTPGSPEAPIVTFARPPANREGRFLREHPGPDRPGDPRRAPGGTRHPSQGQSRRPPITPIPRPRPPVSFGMSRRDDPITAHAHYSHYSQNSGSGPLPSCGIRGSPCAYGSHYSHYSRNAGCRPHSANSANSANGLASSPARPPFGPHPRFDPGPRTHEWPGPGGLTRERIWLP
jgi:hypothetical protein